MSNSTRRRVIAALAAAPALAVPATIALASSAAEELKAIHAALRELGTRDGILFHQRKAAQVAAFRECRPPSPPVAYLPGMTPADYRRKVFYRLRSLERHKARQHRLMTEHDYFAAIETMEALRLQRYELEDRAIAIQATDAASMHAKALIARENGRVCYVLTTDILSMFGGGEAA